MRYWLVISFVLTSLLSKTYACIEKPTVELSSFPKNKQLYARDLSTNMALVSVNGKVVKVNDCLYDSIEVRVFNNTTLYTSLSQELIYTNDTANFNISVKIEALLVNYKVELIGFKSDIEEFLYLADSVVAGDVFVINGQSNALAYKRTGIQSMGEYESPFIRSFSGGYGTAAKTLKDTLWHIGKADSLPAISISDGGNIGQWGIKLARFIVDSMQVPIAVFNGAKANSPIVDHLRPIGYKTNVDGIYSRLYYRLEQTNLRDKVRALIWYQGETDALNSTSLAEYKTNLSELLLNWKEDYPNVKQFYITQIRPCGVAVSMYDVVQITEAQRQVAYDNVDVSLVMANGNEQHTDGCHFDTTGYSSYARKLFPIFHRDLYQQSYTSEIDFPKIVRAKFGSSFNKVVIETDASSLSVLSNPNHFVIEEPVGVSVTGIAVLGGDIILTLSQQLSEGASISYYGPARLEEGNLIVNSNGLDIPSFYKLEITSIVMGVNNQLLDKKENVYPNPVSSTFYINGDIKGKRIVLYDLQGSLVKVYNQNYNAFNIEGLKKGMYFLKIGGGQIKELLIE